jgi:hypothetical protein
MRKTRRLTRREIHTFHDHLAFLAVFEREMWRTLATLAAWRVNELRGRPVSALSRVNPAASITRVAKKT